MGHSEWIAKYPAGSKNRVKEVEEREANDGDGVIEKESE